MCETTMRMDGKAAGQKLARLMEKQLGYVEGHIDNIALRLFIRAYWSQVSTLAHAIHEEDRPVTTTARNTESLGAYQSGIGGISS